MRKRLRSPPARSLLLAVQDNDATEVRSLVNQGVYLDHQDEIGSTALMFAAEDHRIDILEILLNAGADINVESQEGRTALHYARHLDTALMLLRRDDIVVGLEEVWMYGYLFTPKLAEALKLFLPKAAAIDISAREYILKTVSSPKVLQVIVDYDNSNLESVKWVTVVHAAWCIKHDKYNALKVILTSTEQTILESKQSGFIIFYATTLMYKPTQAILKVSLRGGAKVTEIGGNCLSSQKEILENERMLDQLGEWKQYPEEFMRIALCWLACCNRLKAPINKDMRYMMISYFARDWILSKRF